MRSVLFFIVLCLTLTSALPTGSPNQDRECPCCVGGSIVAVPDACSNYGYVIPVDGLCPPPTQQACAIASDCPAGLICFFGTCIKAPNDNGDGCASGCWCCQPSGVPQNRACYACPSKFAGFCTSSHESTCSSVALDVSSGCGGC